MRPVIVAFLVPFSLAACLQAGEPIAPRIRVPGESNVEEQLTVSDSFLTDLGVIQDDLKAIQDQVKKLNEQRATLLTQLKDAREKLQAAQQNLNKVVTELQSQETALQSYIQERVPREKRTDFPILAQLQPVIDWLKLSKKQVDDLMAKQRELLANDPRPRLAEASRAIRERPAAKPMDADERKQYITLLKSATDFNQKWLANIESVLDDEQKKLWAARYRRTLYPVGAGT